MISTTALPVEGTRTPSAEQLRRGERRVVPVALLLGSRLWREGRGGLRRGGGKLQVSILLSSGRAQGGAQGEVRRRIGT